MMRNRSWNDSFVDENQRTFRTGHERKHQRSHVPQLPIVEDALQRRRLRLHEEVDFFLQVHNVGIMLGEAPVHLVFKLAQT